MKTFTFESLGAETYDIQKVCPVGENVGGYGDVAVQIINADGTWGGQYWWYTGAGWGVETDGWYDDEDALASYMLENGQALMVQSDSDVSFQVSGSVAESIENTIASGWSMMGNSSPVAVDIQKIAPKGENVGGYGDVSIQFMNADGTWGEQYWWYTSLGWGVEVDGWYDASDVLATGSVAPGDGFMVQCDADDVVLTIPSAIIK